MDIELRREVRARLTELEDRVKRLEDAQSAASEPNPIAAAVTSPAPKKAAPEASTGEKETI